MSTLNPPLLPGVTLQLVGTALQGPPGVRGRGGLSAYEVWKMNGNPTGTVADYLLSLKGTTGDNGRNIELQKSASHVQWRLQGDATWINLIPLEDVKGVDGQDGEDGRSVFSILRIDGNGTPGTTDTFQITYSTGAPSFFTVTHGADGTNGRGIANIARTAGAGVAGTTDTYTITYTDATTSTFNVYNGADGIGTGDMAKATYDTNNNGKVDTAEVADAAPWAGITDKPTFGTASALNAPAAGNAATSEVVKGDDTRLSDARTPTTHTHGTSDVTGLSTALTTLSDHLGASSNAHPASAVANTPAGNISATTVQDAINELDSEKFAKAGGDIAGNVNLTGTGRRITGDFSNETITARTAIQTSTANGNTFLNLAPSGAAAASGLIVTSSSDLTNYSSAEMVVTPSAAIFRSSQAGTGTIAPLEMNITATKCMRLDPTTFAFTSVNGPIGYGVGAGGTVTQATSKSTAVTLNKPSGQITMHNESLAAGATATFTLSNTTIQLGDVVSVAVIATGAISARYRVRAGTGTNGAVIYLENTSGSAQADSVQIFFNVHKGSTS